jgi:peptidoglycan hydrolase-like protein with peptidoglycan-binding domain
LAQAQAGEALLTIGQKGSAVRELQKKLNARFGAGLTEDGYFGPKTFAAVVSAQQQLGIKVDGLVGPQTYSALWSNTDSDRVEVRPPTTQPVVAALPTDPNAALAPPTGRTQPVPEPAVVPVAAPVAPQQPTPEPLPAPSPAPVPATVEPKPAPTQVTPRPAAAPRTERPYRLFPTDANARLREAEALLRQNGVTRFVPGHIYAIQKDRNTPSDRGQREGFLKAYTGEIALFRGTANGTLEEISNKGPFTAASHPRAFESQLSPDVDGNGRRDAAHLVPGLYEYKTSAFDAGGRRRLDPVAAKLPVKRDTNQDGQITGAEASQAYEAGGIQIHNGDETTPSSIGCQTIKKSQWPEFEAYIATSSGGTFHYLLQRLSSNGR